MGLSEINITYSVSTLLWPCYVICMSLFNYFVHAFYSIVQKWQNHQHLVEWFWMGPYSLFAYSMAVTLDTLEFFMDTLLFCSNLASRWGLDYNYVRAPSLSFKFEVRIPLAPYGEMLTALAFCLRRTLAPSALDARASPLAVFVSVLHQNRAFNKGYIAAFAKHLLDVFVSQTSDKRLSK